MRTFILMSRLCPHGPSMIEAVSRLQSGEKAERAWIDRVLDDEFPLNMFYESLKKKVAS